jgi:hypothetical protein
MMEVVLAEGVAEQAHTGSEGWWSWLALKDSNDRFVRMPKIRGQKGKLIWVQEDE